MFSFLRPCILILLPAILFSAMPASAQPVKNYTAQWKKADEYIKKNLPKSALAEVKKIYALAKKDGSAGSPQDAQLIKSLVYMAGLQDETREDNELLAIREMEKELTGSKEPVTSIINSLVAGMYFSYFENHRWQLYDRTKTTQFKKDDIATWGAEDFHKKISELYLKSIKDEKLLKQAKLEPFNAIVIHGNVRHLRPTLFDLLAHRALDYFKNDETDIAKPAYAFEINRVEAFAPAAEFLKTKFSTKDSVSLKHKALLLYQQLISFHISDSKPDALLDLDISRLEYVKENIVLNNKEELFENALESITKKYGDNPAAAQAWYLIANSYNEKAGEYKPYGDSMHRMSKLIAKEICERVLKQKDSSEGKINCYNLFSRIPKKELKFSLEKINVPGLPFRSLVEYRNINDLYLRIIKTDEKLKKELENRNDDKYWPALIKAAALKSWQQPLPVTTDLQQHSVEIKINALPPGEYILLACSEKDFDLKKSIIGARMFYVSAISYVKSGKEFFVLNRESGQPLSKAAVQVWEQRYDNKQSKYIKQKSSSHTADANGYFRIPDPSEKNYSYSYALEITHNAEKFFPDDWLNEYYYSNQNDKEKDHTGIFLFTDRSIYRPGQTLYFKGIAVLSKANNTKQVNDKLETFIYLRDANYQTIDSQKVKTNEYGSFSGKFQLPQSGLNGNFTIYTKDNTGAASFRMEQYKRPKFFVDYEPLKGTYKVNDSIKITGFAKAYAGNNIDGANVKYRVVRQPRFIYPWLWRKWWMPPSEEMEITHGETKTDKDGKFTVEFKAIPDLKIEKKFEPVFDYTIYADITDINGETRSGEQSVSVSYKSLILKTDIPGILPADSLKSLSIRTENMNGEFQPARINVTITKLKEEKRLIRSRFWNRPDQFIMSKEEYIRDFPYDEYDNETDNTSWENAEVLLSKTDSLNENKPFTIHDSRLMPGFYQIEILTKDKNGEEVKDIQFIELFDEKSSQLNHPEYLWTSTKTEDPEPGEKMTVNLGTAAGDLFIIQELNKKSVAGSQKSEVNFSFIKLNNEKKNFDYEAAETDRGGFAVAYLFVKHNRFHQFQQSVRVPWSNKDLKIEYATFRDKTLPGSEEKWKVKITGIKKEKVAAEMLASMYDASLDQIYFYSWYKPSVWIYHYYNPNWNGSQNFAKIESQQKWNQEEEKSFYKWYDELLTDYYGLEYQNTGFGYVNLKGMKRESRYFASPVLLRDGNVDNNNNSYAELAVSGEVVKKPDQLGDGVSDKFDKEEEANKQNQQNSETQIRKNFNETAFFLPDLKTNETGDIEFSFTMPEALTKWKFQALAHTKDLAFGYSSKEIVTQKDLMVQPNPPRFLREGDKIEFSSKIVNLTDKEITGQAQFQLFDASTNEAVDGRFRNVMANQYFTVAAGQSEAISFPMEIPFQFNKALLWRIVAKAGDISDGEENALPVLTNRMLVTETKPLTMRGAGSKDFKFDKLLNSGASTTLKHHTLTVEYTSNPVWYAVQALPYLMEYPYECAEQTWNRYYANSLASKIANSSPRIKEIFKRWADSSLIPPSGGGGALMSNLQKNQELKALLLEETPWVLQAKNEEQQKKNIALLFDLMRMSNEMNSAYEKLKQMQSPGGGFVWFKGGPDNAYMTQYIVTGIGHLKKLGVDIKKLLPVVQAAIPYLDKQIKKEYDDLKKYKTNMKSYMPGNYEVQYLYMRSFFPEYKIAAASQTAYNYFRTQSQKKWTKQGKYMQGMIALALQRTGDAKTPAAILKSLKETSILNEELGMYWKELTNGGFYWYQAPIETHSLLIEVFSEAGKDTKTVDDLKTWLLKNKQTNNWKTTKATAEACYALMLQGTNWLNNEPVVEIKLSDLLLTSSKGGGTEPAEEGTGYFKKTIDGDKIKQEMGNISVKQEPALIPPSGGGGASWGSVYWQYFEDLGKITTASTPLKLEKKLFIEKNTDRGPVLTPVNDGDFLKVGDKIKVRIELRVDRDMEYVHMKDMRASAMEPINVLSSYKWQGGLGYYETTKDASTNFFFDNLRKGTYVFEYPLFVTHKGNFSNGITTIQCMYAPEFSSHSEGVRVNVE